MGREGRGMRKAEVRYLSVFDKREVDEYGGFPSKTWNRNACLKRVQRVARV